MNINQSEGRFYAGSPGVGFRFVHTIRPTESECNMFAIPDEQFPTTITDVMVIVPPPNPEDPDEKCPSCEGFKRALDRSKIPYVETTKAEAPTHVQEQIDAHKIQTAPTIVADGTVVAAGGLQIPVVRRIIAAYKPAPATAGV